MVGFIVVVIGVFLLLAVMKPLITGIDLTETGIKVVDGVVQSLVATVILYVGAMIQKNRDTNGKE